MPAGASRPRAAGGFALPPDEAPAARLAAAEEVAGLSALIGLQAETEPVADREARRHGQELLTHLAALHRALLEAGGGGLDALRGLVAAAPAAAQDPRLADAVAAIRLRAMVELARYSTAR